MRTEEQGLPARVKRAVTRCNRRAINEPHRAAIFPSSTAKSGTGDHVRPNQLRWTILALAVLGCALLVDFVLASLTLEDNPEARPTWLLAIQVLVAVILLAVAGSLAALSDHSED